MSDTLKKEFNAMAASVIKNIFKEIKDSYTNVDRLKKLLEPFNDKEVAKVMVAHGAGLDSKDENGDTPLLFAAKKTSINIKSKEKQIAIMSLLLEHGANPEARDVKGDNSLHIIWQDDDLRNLLVNKGADINSGDSKGRTILIKSIHDMNPYRLKKILENGADINRADADGNTSLHHILISEASWDFCDRYALFNILLEKGANLNAKNNNGDTPLMLATMEPKCNIEWFIKNKADVNVENNAGERALDIAVRQESNRKVEALLDAGARRGKSFNPVYFAVQNKLKTIVYNLVKIGNFDVNVQDDQDKTAAHIAAEHNSYKEMEILIKFGARMYLQDKDGNTPLHIAADKGSRESAMVIMGADPDIKIKNKQGKSPFDIALDKDDKDMMKILSGDKVVKAYIKLKKLGY